MLITSKNVIQLMDGSGLNARQFEIKCNLPNASIQAWRNEKSTPSQKSLQKIADAFHLPISYFYEAEHTDKPNTESVSTSPTANSRPDLVIPEILQNAGIGFHEGAENLTQEDIDDMALALELSKKRRK